MTLFASNLTNLSDSGIKEDIITLITVYFIQRPLTCYEVSYSLNFNLHLTSQASVFWGL